MLGEARQQRVLQMLYDQKFVRIGELSDLFDVSEETIRRDLKKLESEGVVRRTHGGAMWADEVDVVPSYIHRSQQNVLEKGKIANRALEYIPQSGTVMLDGGSTTIEIAKLLLQRSLTVVTSDLYVALEVSKSLQLQLIVLGGVQQKGTSALVGPECVSRVEDYNVDVAFIGTGGFSGRHGLTTASSAEAEVKKAMIRVAAKVYCVADATKLGRAALISYAKVSDVDAIITNADPVSSDIDELKQLGAVLNFV